MLVNSGVYRFLLVARIYRTLLAAGAEDIQLTEVPGKVRRWETQVTWMW